MPGAMVVPLLFATALALLVGAAHRRLPPVLATRATTVALVVVTAAAVPTVWLAGLSFLTHAPVLGRWLDSCVEPLSAHHPVAVWIGVPALLISAFGTWRSVRVLRTYRSVRQTTGGVEVVDHDDVFAFTAPGKGGRIVVSSALDACLSPDELDVVLAHERAHAAHRHDRYLLVAQLAAALLAPLQPLVSRLRFSIERWADEEAVAVVGNRRFVARTLGNVALRSADRQPALAFAGLGVAARMAALLAPPVHEPRGAVRAVLLLLVGLVTVFAVFQVHHLVQMLLAFCL
jgi:hypothetical protein